MYFRCKWREKRILYKKWDVLNLCKTINISLHCSVEGCKRKVAFKSPNSEYFWNEYYKKCKYQIPSKDDKLTTIKKKKIADVKQYCAQKLIFINVSDKKNDIIKNPRLSRKTFS